MPLISVIIPTFNNKEYLYPCVSSILTNQSTSGLLDIIVVNNGDKGSLEFPELQEIKLIEAGKNLGWEGGLKEGLKHTDAPYIVFMNDDTFIHTCSAGWAYEMIQRFSDTKVAAVGPSSNCVMGVQNIFVPTGNNYDLDVNILIGFCMMVKRTILDEVGGIDDSMPNHGDDMDLSIRFREAGYKLKCVKGVFVYHHGFKTGQREFGSEWNSVQMTEKTNTWLIKKHGFKIFMKYVFNPLSGDPPPFIGDIEGDICRKYAKGDVLELGCGGTKTVPNAMGLDIVPKGEFIPNLPNTKSIADLTADISDPLPLDANSFDTVIARHLLEHLINPLKVLKEWSRVIRPGGRLIIAVPNQNIRSTIPLNPQHVHAYTPDSLKEMMETLGWHTEALEDPKNYISFCGVFTKNGVSNGLK